ncbi:MAG: hypothetical protein Q9186_004684 [Xanthomendoza sp. 1 TL-2023]
MASILFAGGILAYEKIKESKAKKTAKKAHNAARYSDLQSATCTCNSLVEKEAGGEKACPVHDASGYMDAEGVKRRDGEGAERREDDGEGLRGDGREKDEVVREGGDEPPRYEDVAGPVGKRGFKDRVLGRREKEGGDGVVR